ncbi:MULTISPECIES: glycoside hydrolase family 3 N-terminal domain-containing protein [Catenuloplanes]|uniref:Exo-alpha-(1->6)-L-arabinopyranosidase n=1 Tax=Catenuloplanes niger TaxID=587534 RepID=A0AAE3ZJ81_9ACTN|nr:glycoside hydrolase family 3 N-terminal domain-containing protein [Catenuloplanes niger]MDR7320883.1 beta-glucosidase [Catenuloplanes niger]
MTTLPYLDPDLPVADRVADLLSRLTLEEKAGQLTQFFYFGSPQVPDGVDVASLPPEQQAPVRVEEAVRDGRAGSLLFVRDAGTVNRMQRMAMRSRLGVPLLFGFDVVHGMRTILPVPIALAASWCPETIEAGQAVAAREARALGIHWTFAPMIDIARDPRWGRIVEGAGEDPYLGAAVAAAQVRGFQGDLGPDRLVAGPKHFAGYGAARGGRDYDDADISDSELWNVYLPPFRAAVDAGALNVMSAYMDLNGVPASGNRWLLTDVLRESFGFAGFVVSDANAVRSLEVQHFARDLTDAGARALDAGLDMEMCMYDPAFARLPEAVAAGLVTEEQIDTAVRRVLTVKFRLGLFENPYADEGRTHDLAAHRDTARVAAERSIVLLKNDGGLLPLAAPARIAVVGELATATRDSLGPWVFGHDTGETVTVLDGLRARFGDGVTHAPGVHLPGRVFPSIFDQMEPPPAIPSGDQDDAEIDRAVALAAGADVAVVVVGQRQNQIGENASSATLDLPGRQLEQLRRITATGTPVVLVVMSGRPLDLRWADAHVPAIVQAWYPGTSGGHAVAAVLAGDVSPAGRLPFTWPRHAGQVPMIYAHHRTFAPQDQDKRYWEEESTPLYPFGHGLSYASFDYANLRTAAGTVAVGATTEVSVDVTNTSAREADEVVQLYIHQRYGSASRPVRELKGFRRLTLAPGETRTVTFPLGPAELSYWNAATRTVVQDATTLDVWAGGSSTATLSTRLEVTP